MGRGDIGETTVHETTQTPVTIESADCVPILIPAALASIGSGLIHAAAAAAHADHAGLSRIFAAVALIQVIVGLGAILRSNGTSTIGALAVAVVNGLSVTAWIATRTIGLGAIGGLERPSAAGLADSLAALFALGAVVGALIATRPGTRGIVRVPITGLAIALCALAPVGILAASSHSAHDHGVGALDAPHVHSSLDAHSGDAIGADHDHDELQPADGAALGNGPAVPPRPYDPELPIDLGGVPGVTPTQQAFAENLVAVTLRYLPQWSDPAVAEAAGFRSIGDGITGHEHFIHWDWIDDDIWLDPRYPESLVFEPQPDGSRRLVSAMYMLPPTMALEDVPDWGGALMQWHVHEDLCFSADADNPRVAAVIQIGASCPAGLRAMQPAPMIHVWIRSHECGPFAALDGIGAGQVRSGEEHYCNHTHGAAPA